MVLRHFSNALLGCLTFLLPVIRCETPYLSIAGGFPAEANIEKLNASIMVPSIPTPFNATYSAIVLRTRDYFYQSIIFSYGDSRISRCGGFGTGQLCIYSQYGSVEPSSPVFSSDSVVIDAFETLQFVIERAEPKYGSTIGFSQTISRNGEILVQSFNSDSSPSASLLFGTFCDLVPAILPQFTYENITISLDKRAPDYIENSAISRNEETNSPIYTSDGGLNFQISTLTLNQSYCPAE